MSTSNFQDPEVVMAPLPLFHRPLSQDNSRETSLSSGRGGGRSTGPDTSGSGSGVSLPLRGQNSTGTKTPNTPGTPSSVMTSSMPNAASSDYLIPLAGNMPKRPKTVRTTTNHNQHRQSVTSHTTGTLVSSPSDDPGSDDTDEDAARGPLLPHSDSKTVVYDNEAETSFTCSSPRTSSSYSNVRSVNRVRRRASGAKLLPSR